MSEASTTVLFRDVCRRLPRGRLRELASRLGQAVVGGRAFTCLLTDDRELRRLNRQFLNRNYATDVLSFPAPGPNTFLGEMAISVDRATEQACRYGHRVEEEIGILMLHGLLHLLRMDHETDRGQMARAETRWRKKLGLPTSLTERGRP